ncbi:hypothetical protein F5Y16DRAFT_399081 [Xylariaceae sp. FL0255]|nr:hypothetical protein F5Y16DRAFT_399081 [Xylariaceae sp. FL0255]
MASSYLDSQHDYAIARRKGNLVFVKNLNVSVSMTGMENQIRLVLGNSEITFYWPKVGLLPVVSLGRKHFAWCHIDVGSREAAEAAAVVMNGKVIFGLVAKAEPVISNGLPPQHKILNIARVGAPVVNKVLTPAKPATATLTTDHAAAAKLNASTEADETGITSEAKKKLKRASTTLESNSMKRPKTAAGSTPTPEANPSSATKPSSNDPETAAEVNPIPSIRRTESTQDRLNEATSVRCRALELRIEVLEDELRAIRAEMAGFRDWMKKFPPQG